MNLPIGEVAALLTSLCWTATSTFFAYASARVGSLVLNRIRLLLAIVFLVITHLLLKVPLPFWAAGDRWLWLSLSGVIGLTLGDAFLFQSYIWIGPRLGMLMMSLAPLISSIAAWLFLNERLAGLQWIGVLVTLGGVAWVVLEGQGRERASAGHLNYWKGILFGVGAATGQALGLITAKLGLYGDFHPLSGTLIRMLAAGAAMWILTLLYRQAGTTFRKLLEERSAIPHILGGVTFGPFLGVTLSLLAVQHAPVGVASTLMALPPVFLLPVGHFLLKERLGWQAVAGTLVAIAGVGLLFLS